MPHATADRGTILHFAGRHGLSPALRDGTPTLVRDPDPGVTRCGWEPFFAALDRSGPALLTDDADPSAARPGPIADRPSHPRASAWGEARRFLAALRLPHAGGGDPKGP